MPSTFFGLTISASGLNASQAQINTTANNISNVRTTGYSKQVVNTVAASALRCYQKYGTTGTGVEVTSVTQCRDQYYDEKYWNNQSDLGFYEKKLYYMNQIESYYSETQSQTGFSTIYAKMFNSMSTLQTNAGDMTVRKEFIANAKELTTYFNSISQKLKALQSSINDEIKTAVDEVNAIAEKIAILNKQINVIEQGGGKANELRDQRALLVDELSEYVTTDVEEVPIKNTNYPDMDTGATYYTVYINGQLLVNNYEFQTLDVKSRDTDEMYNQSDVDGLYDIVWKVDGNNFNPVNSANSGSIKSMFEVRDGNNCENMVGTITATTPTSITISNVSDTDINELNLASAGALFANSTEYCYSDFVVNTDKDGKIESITFNLADDCSLDATDMINLRMKSAVCGASVDYMGIPYYMNQMNIFLRNFCEQFNQIEQQGVDLNGNAMSSFFIANSLTDTEELTMIQELIQYQYDTTPTDAAKGESDLLDANNNRIGKKDKDGNIIYALDADGNKIPAGGVELKSDGNFYYRLTAESVGIAYASDKDSSIFSTTTKENYSSGQDATDLVVLLQDLQSKTTIFRGGGGDSFLQCIYADVTVDTQECKIFTKNYESIQTTIDEQRQSVSGVDEDEEALDLIKFQNAYNLSSKCISVFTEIYDRLILQTGV